MEPTERFRKQVKVAYAWDDVQRGDAPVSTFGLQVGHLSSIGEELIATITRLEAANLELRTKLLHYEQHADKSKRPFSDHFAQEVIARQVKEIDRLSALVVDLRAKLETVKAETLEKAAQAGYVTCAETRHVRLGDKVAAAIRSIKNKDQQNV